MSAPKQIELLGLDAQSLTDIMSSLGQPAYRGRQLYHSLYGERVSSIDDISTLPKQVRAALQERYTVGLPVIEKQFLSADGTIRYLMAFSDGQTVETVWMPEGDGGEIGDGSEAGEDSSVRSFDRATICVSSQVGCAIGCQFCMTALLGVKRSLTTGEIVGQIIAVLNERKIAAGRERINLVFMGMGEPFLNYDNFVKAVRLLVVGVGIPESRMTVSTSGIVPRIYDFAKESVRPKLAISLNAPEDHVRSRVMPINRKWNLDALLAAAREFPLRPRERLTFEYVLLDSVNDAADDARRLVRLLQGIKCKVNLIALNPGPEIPFNTPKQIRVDEFQTILVRAGIPAFVRKPRGRDIYAACGQLKRTTAIVNVSPAVTV